MDGRGVESWVHMQSITLVTRGGATAAAAASKRPCCRFTQGVRHRYQRPADQSAPSLAANHRPTRVSYVGITDYTARCLCYAITVSHSLNFTVQTALTDQWEHGALRRNRLIITLPRISNHCSVTSGFILKFGLCWMAKICMSCTFVSLLSPSD